MAILVVANYSDNNCASNVSFRSVEDMAVNSALASKLELRKLAMQQHVSIIVTLHRQNPPALRVF